MDVGLLAQYVMNGLMLGMMYALVAVGFTLFFGVLDVIKFSHGDVLTVGAFTALATYIGLRSVGLSSSPLLLLACAGRRDPRHGGARHADRALSGAAAALGAGAQHAADHADARHGAARIGAALLPARRQPEAVSGACFQPTQSTSASSTCGSTTPSCWRPASRSSSGCSSCSTAPSSVSPSARWRRTKRPRARWASTSPPSC